jgi:hypothetical protein
MFAPKSILDCEIPPAGFVQWSLDVLCNKFKLGESFSVFVFLGRVPENQESWQTSPNFVGTFDAIVNATPRKCENCRALANSNIRGAVSLTYHLLARGLDITDRSESGAVIAHLNANLNWKVWRVSDYLNPSARVLPPLNFFSRFLQERPLPMNQ